MITEQVHKAYGLNFEELDAQGAELLPDRVEMTRKKKYSPLIFQQNNNATFQLAIAGKGDATNVNLTEQSNNVG